MFIRKTKLQKSMDILTEKLIKDESLYYGWQSNIAMSFYDEYRRSHVKVPKDLKDIANEAAKDFLNRLIKER